MKKINFSCLKYSFINLFRCGPAYVIFKFIIAVYEGIFGTVGLILLRNIVNNIEKNAGFYDSLFYLFLYCIVILAFQLLISLVEMKSEPRFTYRLKKTISMQMFEKAVAVDVGCYEDSEYYNQYCRAMSFSYTRQRAVLDSLLLLLKTVITFILSGVLSFLIDPFVILFAFLPFLTLLLKNKSKAINYEANKKISDINRKKSYVMRTFYQDSYAKEMRTTKIHKPLLKLFIQASEDIKKVYKTNGSKAAGIWILETFLSKVLSEYVVFLYAGWKTLISRTMHYGDCLVIVSTMQSVYDSINNILECISTLAEHSMYLEDLHIFLTSEPTIVQDDKAIVAKNGDICLQNVTFRYPKSEKVVLDRINITIKKGERVAIVGPNGSGKSTLVKLLLRLYDPVEGSISLCGVDYKNLQLYTLRERYAVVLQDYKHFSISLKENIALGTPVDDEKIFNAIVKSGLAVRVEKMSDGIDSILDKELSDHGEILSGGEMQKLSISGVYYRDSDIVILDEPASALDPIAEYELYKHMLELTKNKTVIFVSHRLSSTVDADKIIYLENGRITEYGSHKELMSSNGSYAKMFQIQAQNYTEI